MDLVSLICAAKNERVVALLAATAGLDAERLCSLLRIQVPLIVDRLRAVSNEDPAAREALFDIVEDREAEAYLDDIRALTSRAAVRDGEDILSGLWGSLEAAREAAREAESPRGVSPELAERLFTHAAVLALAAMSRRYHAEGSPLSKRLDALRDAGKERSVSANSRGMIAMILIALLEGLFRGLMRALLPRRRRRYRYRRRHWRHARKGRRGRRVHRRRKRRDRALLEDILRGR